MSTQGTVSENVSGTLGRVFLKEVQLEKRDDFIVFLDQNAERIETLFEFMWLSYRKKSRLVYFLDDKDILLRQNEKIWGIFTSTSYLRCNVVESNSKFSLVGEFHVNSLKRVFSKLIFSFALLLPLYFAALHIMSARELDIVEIVSVLLGVAVFSILAKMVKDVRFSLLDRVHVRRLCADLEAIRIDM